MTVASVLLGLSLLAAPDAEPKKFVLDVSRTTQTLAKGNKGSFFLQIRPIDGYKVNDKGPFSLRLSASEHLALEKALLGRSDATGHQDAPELGCGFEARAPGEGPIVVEAQFVLCDKAGTVCEMKREKVEVAVKVD